MMPALGQLTWGALIVGLGAILLLAARVDVFTGTGRDASVKGGLTALVTCVLPATAGQASTDPATVPETSTPDCDLLAPDPLGALRMTAC